MSTKWKSWLGAAAVLLLMGQGCGATVRQDADVDVTAPVQGGVNAGGSGNVQYQY